MYEPFKEYFNLMPVSGSGSPTAPSSSPDDVSLSQGSYFSERPHQSSRIPIPVLGRGSNEGTSSPKLHPADYQNGYFTQYNSKIISTALNNTSSLIGDPEQRQDELFMEMRGSRHSSGSDTVVDVGLGRDAWNMCSTAEQNHACVENSYINQRTDRRHRNLSGRLLRPTSLEDRQVTQWQTQSADRNTEQDLSSTFDSVMTLQDELDINENLYSRHSSDCQIYSSDPLYPQSVPWNTPTNSVSDLFNRQESLPDKRTNWIPVDQNGYHKGSGSIMNGDSPLSERSSAFGSPLRNGKVGFLSQSGCGFDSPTRIGTSASSSGDFGSPLRRNSYSDGPLQLFPPTFNCEVNVNPVSEGWFDGTLNGVSINLQHLSVLLQQYLQAQNGNLNVRNDNYRSNNCQLDEGKFCAFCKKNRETPEFYRTHVVKDSRGKVICPVLRKYTCPVCQASGDRAHTLRHCPVRFQNRFLEQQIHYSQMDRDVPNANE